MNVAVGDIKFTMDGTSGNDTFSTLYNSVAIQLFNTCNAPAGTVCANGLSANQFYGLNIGPDQFHDNGDFSYSANGGPFKFLGQLSNSTYGNGDQSVVGLYISNGAEVPEPAPMALFGVGFLVLSAIRRRRNINAV